MKKEYKQMAVGNFISNLTEDCFISYNPRLDANLAGKSETALVFTVEGKKTYFIYHGDQRHIFDDCDNQSSLIDKAISFRDSPEFDIAFWSDDWNKLDSLRNKS